MKKVSYMILASVMVLSAIVLIYLLAGKEGMHVDEYYTYGLANHEEDGDIYITTECGVKLNPNDVFDRYFYADSFSIRNVWLNQSYDVHPPLYYLIFHIFGLLTGNFLGLKTGVLLNIVFHLCNIGLVYVIIQKLTKREYAALLGAGIYAFLPPVLGKVLFIRMYVMVTMIVLLLTLLFIERISKGEDMRRFYLKLGILSAVGALTHYYFLLYLFACCVIWGIRLLLMRKWKETGIFVGTMALSGLASIAIFPYMLRHIFVGYRGEEAFSAAVHNSVSSWFKHGKDFWGMIDEVCGGMAIAFVVIAVCLALLHLCYHQSDRAEYKEKAAQWIMVFVPCAFYFLALSRFAPQYSRYLTPVFGSVVILLTGLAVGIGQFLRNDRAAVAVGVMIAALLINNGWTTYTWPEQHKEAKDAVKTAREYGVNHECIYVFNRIWRSMPSYQEFIQYQNMSFISEDNLELLDQDQYENYDSVVVYLDKAIGEDKIKEIMDHFIKMNPDLTEYSELYEYSYNIAYYCS